MQTLSTRLRLGAAVTLACGLSVAAQAQVAEDSSAAFKAENEALGAALGLPAAESTVTIDENGMMSADMGLEAMKMLVVRRNADGTLSYGHADTEAGAQAFINSAGSGQLEEH